MPPETDDVIPPLDLVLHIGSGKTGTSSIQAFLNANRSRLAEEGVLYPRSLGRTRHTRFGLSIMPDETLGNMPSWKREKAASPEEFRATVHRRLLREIRDSGLSRVLISDEALYGSPVRALRTLNRFVDQVAARLRIVVYLRRQDDHLISRYQQVVKIGETRRLVRRTQDLMPSFGDTYDYYDRLHKWQRVLEPDDLVIRRFERSSFADGSLYQDLLEAAAVDARADELEQVRVQNESLDAETIELLRILNLVRAENADAASVLPDARQIVHRLASVSSGPVLTMPEPLLDEFMSRWEESNERVARELLGDDSGILFREGRKSTNVTVDQHLDPARLDFFLEALELPEQVHRPLRELVEREAAQLPNPDEGLRRTSGQSANAGDDLPTHYDDAAKKVIERVRPRTMTQPEKLFGLIEATRYVVRHGIAGDIVECGVWRGGSMQAVALTLQECGDTSRDLHLFDTFEGMTPPEDVDRRVDGRSAAELLAAQDRSSRVWGVATLEDVKHGMSDIGYPQERIHYHVGPVEETVPDQAPGSVAILRLDTDWYASTRHELEHLYDRLAPGGVLIIDDYGYWEGSRRATDEFLARTGERLLLLPIADGRITVKPGPGTDG